MITYQSSTDSYFNPRSLAGATDCSCLLIFRRIHFNPRSLAGATQLGKKLLPEEDISIHAPLRERQFDRTATSVAHVFQSTLPRGSDLCDVKRYIHLRHFNPRSLAGATRLFLMTILLQKISIHAPSRERHDKVFGYQERYAISIHAPSRERPIYAKESIDACYNFNPRSLTGATSISLSRTVRSLSISIHAPSRERRGPADRHNVPPDFNPRSLTGATSESLQ